jgi:hypothetical protein
MTKKNAVIDAYENFFKHLVSLIGSVYSREVKELPSTVDTELIVSLCIFEKIDEYFLLKT